MKKILLFGFTLVMILGSLSCNAQDNKKVDKAKTSNKVEAYYFHFTGRCVTCKTVEAEAKADLKL
jgi:hypothetical protein